MRMLHFGVDWELAAVQTMFFATEGTEGLEVFLFFLCVLCGYF